MKLDKYGISSKRYKELCGFCEQYPEWKEKLANLQYMNGVSYDDMPHSPNVGTSDTTSNLAIKNADLLHKCNLIEEVAKSASDEFCEAIIKAVCYEVPVNYLIAYEHIPISKSAFYEKRRYFFYLLDKAKKD